MRRLIWYVLIVALSGLPTGAAGPMTEVGNAVIRGKVGPSDIVLTTTSRVAGAISSLQWNGKEFVDNFDHGRELQSAVNLDVRGRLLPEVYNPTEAGSKADGRGLATSSRLLRFQVDRGELLSTTQMAFWLRPGEKSGRSNGQRPAENDAVLSPFLLTKKVQIGYKSLPHVISYFVTFALPATERHTRAVFEVVTGYMPAEFDHYWKFNVRDGKLERLHDGVGEQSFPLVFATDGGAYAMGIYLPGPQPRRRTWLPVRYGYHRFQDPYTNVNKWSCIQDIHDVNGLAAGKYSFQAFVIVGTLHDVQTSLDALVRDLSHSPLMKEGGTPP
jgi:hypothetical protein